MSQATVRSPGRNLTTRAIVIAVAVGCATLLLLAASVGEVVKRATSANRKVQCANNLKNIGGMIQEGRVSRRALRGPAGSGILDVYVRGLIRRGGEYLFVCPQDPSRAERMAAWESGSPSPTEPGASDLLASYVLRDLVLHPIPKGSREKSPLALCLHHGSGVNVLYDDCSVVFLDREALGLGEDDPIESGPDSKSELLRVFPPRER